VIYEDIEASIHGLLLSVKREWWRSALRSLACVHVLYSSLKLTSTVPFQSGVGL